MPDTTTESSSKKKGGSKKKMTPIQTGALVIGGVLVAYLGYRWYENKQSTAATTAATTATPATGAAGSGTDANGNPNDAAGTLNGTQADATGNNSGAVIDPTTGDYYTNESPFSGLDPTTGLSWGATIDELETQILAFTTGGATDPGTSISTGTGSTSSSGALAAWEAKARAQLIKDGVAPAEATSAVKQYVNGQSVTGSLGAASALQQFVDNNTPPTKAGAAQKVTVGKGATLPSQDAALKHAEAQAAQAKRLHNPKALAAAQAKEKSIRAK